VELEVLPVELKVRGLKRCFGDPEAVSGFCVCPLRDECLRGACATSFDSQRC